MNLLTRDISQHTPQQHNLCIGSHTFKRGFSSCGCSAFHSRAVTRRRKFSGFISSQRFLMPPEVSSAFQRAQTPASQSLSGAAYLFYRVCVPAGDASGPEGGRHRYDVQPAGQPGCHHLQLLLQRHGRDRRLHGLHGGRQQPAGPLLRVVQPGPELHQHTCGHRRLPSR